MNSIKKNNFRNFAIIAHIDHGKSTLANALIKKCNGLYKTDPSSALCRLSLEKTKGITIKLHAVQLNYHFPVQKEDFIFNLIDTPGHIDFQHEVKLSLSVCEGVILLVDAVKGIQAQTLFYYRIAEKLNLIIIPVINKIDLPTSQVNLVQKQLQELLSCSLDEIILISAKTGHNIDKLLENIIQKITPPVNKELNIILNVIN